MSYIFPLPLFIIKTMTHGKTYIRKTRYAVQLFFLLLTGLIGYQFYSFVQHFQMPGYPFVSRPPSVDAFMPIAGLVSLKYFLFTGVVEPFHPAALIMFVAILAVSVFLKKGFCGWICPIGTVSQYLWMAGEKIFGRNFRLEKYTDIAMRSIKYFVMALFLLLIGVAMMPNMMVLFFISDYYRIVDVKTMQFFTNMSATTFWVLSGILLLSLLYKNFWCRYLCPYGALLGLVSKVSPLKVVRSAEKCIHCHACSKNCPALIDVESRGVVKSAECFGCMTCISRCPSEGALEMALSAGKIQMNLRAYLYPVILVAVFYMIIGFGMASGNWHSNVPYEEYKRIIQAEMTERQLSLK